MLIVFVHGWSVTETGTYGGLPKALANNAPPGQTIRVAHLYLGKYVSFFDNSIKGVVFELNSRPATSNADTGSGRLRQRHIHINLIPRHKYFAIRILLDDAQLQQRGDIGMHIFVMPPQLLCQRVNGRRADAF